MAKTLEDTITSKNNLNSSADSGKQIPAVKNSSSLESRASSFGNGMKSAGRALFTGGILAATYGMVGMSSLLTAGGNAVGYLIEKFKEKSSGQKIAEVVEEKKMHQEIRTGGIMGTLGYMLYSMIDFIPNYSIPLKLVKTIAFNPIMLAPYVAFFQAFTYLRDKVGAAKSIAGVFTLKIFKYLKDAYRYEIKPKFKESMKKVMYLMPIHFASINYVQEVWKRVAIGVFNDIALRLFMSKKNEARDYMPAKNHYNNNLQPAYG